jgi:hypothetical protein
MARHILNLHYDGLRAAERNELAPSASAQVVPGARLLLGAHANFYLNGIVPDRILEKGPGYEIGDLGRREGSWVADFVINFLSNETSHLLHLAFEVYLFAYIQHWKDGREFADQAERREPYFGSYGGVNEPFIDSVADREHQLRRLSRRTTDAVWHLTAAIGTSASVLTMSLDGRVIAVFDRRYPLNGEQEITEALSVYRQSQPTRRPRYNG